MFKLYVEAFKPMNTEKYIDLHTHTAFSDGTYTPSELIVEAKKRNLAAIAITDHDCISGIDEAINTGSLLDIEVISGIELAAYYPFPQETEIHIVGLFIDHKNPTFIAKINELMKERNQRNMKMAKKLTSLGFPITYDDLMEEAGAGSCSRAHYAKLMLKKGYVQTKKEAFQKYIGIGKPGFIPRSLPSPKECIDLILNSGGCAILAHPTLYNMDFKEINSMAKDLKEQGLTGIETMYSTFTTLQEKKITQISKELKLLPSGGSDFHGLNKSNIFLGVGKGNLRIPYNFLEQLKTGIK